MRALSDTRIGIIGLGYVGLPLAVEFGKHFSTVGFDIKKERIAELENGTDSTLEATSEELRAVHDPWASSSEAEHEYGISLIDKPKSGSYDAIVVAVAHKEFLDLGVSGIRSFGSPNTVIFDIKHVLPKDASDGRL